MMMSNTNTTYDKNIEQIAFKCVQRQYTNPYCVGKASGSILRSKTFSGQVLVTPLFPAPAGFYPVDEVVNR